MTHDADVHHHIGFCFQRQSPSPSTSSAPNRPHLEPDGQHASVAVTSCCASHTAGEEEHDQMTTRLLFSDYP